MIKSVKKTILVALSIMAALMAGCGTDDSGGGGSATIVTGTASKGIIYPGSVSVFSVSGGVKSSTPLKTVETDPDGKFTADLGQYAGPIVIEVTGKYTDEATAAPVTIDAANPLRAAISDVGGVAGGKTCAVTPLTDLAYSLIEGSPLTNENIGAANARVGGIFKLNDITGTEPVHPNAAVLGTSGVTVEQQAYTIALATLSQMAKDAGGGTPATFTQIKDIIGSFKDDLAASPDAGLVPANTGAFTAALGTVTAPTATLGGFDDASSKLQNVNLSEIKLTLSVGTAPTGTLIGALEGTITLPPGTSVRTEGSSETVRSSQFVAGSSALAVARYTAGTGTVKYALLYGSGYSGGDFATLQIDIQKGVTVTAADFKLSGSKVIDTARNTMNNIAITIK
jgi:hypothetical protein